MHNIIQYTLGNSHLIECRLSNDLHTFVDASVKAFAAVTYLRTFHDLGIDISIVAAKSKVALTKPMSIPRLELQGAVLRTRLNEAIKRELRLKVQTEFLWTDSKTVLAWLNSEPRAYNQFVVLRIGEILEFNSPKQ